MIVKKLNVLHKVSTKKKPFCLMLIQFKNTKAAPLGRLFLERTVAYVGIAGMCAGTTTGMG